MKGAAWLGVLTVALLLWGCGGAQPEPRGAETPESGAMATSAEALTCPASDITSGQFKCAGGYTYSLECYGLKASSVCGQDTSAKTCTTYGTCQHLDFGKTRGTYTQTAYLAFDGSNSCDDLAQAHLSSLSASDRSGVTYTYTMTQDPGGDPMLTSKTGFGVDSLMSGGGGAPCYITYSNYPMPATGTGPQCGTESTTCAPACVNYQMCRHPDFGTGATSTEVITRNIDLDYDEGTCDSKAQEYIATLPAHRRTGATYTYASQYYSTGLLRCTITVVTPDYVMGSGPQCGTMVGPCSATSVSPTYKECRHASHGEAVDSQCGAGFENAQAPAGSTPAQVEALAASQWTAAKSVGSPVYDAPITCSDCRPPHGVSKQELDRQVYVAAAMHRVRAVHPHLHILAGSAYYLAKDNPAMTQAELAAALNSISQVLGTQDPVGQPYDFAKDEGGPMVRLLIRVLSDAEPAMVPTTPAGKALRAYAQAFLGSMRNGLTYQRRLVNIHSQVELYGDAEAFIQESWGRLFDQARGNTALAAAVDSGPIGTSLGLLITQSAAEVLAVHTKLEPMRSFVLAHLQPDGSLAVSESDARAQVTAASTQGLEVVRKHALLLAELETAESAYRESFSLMKAGTAAPADTAGDAGTASDAGTPKTPEQLAFEAEIERLTKKREELKKTLDGVRQGVTGGLSLTAKLFELKGDKEFAGHITKFSKALDTTLTAVVGYTESSVKMAEKLGGFLDMGAKGIEALSGAIFTGQLIGAVFQLFSLLNASPTQPPIEETILKEVRELKQLITDVRNQLMRRFDRVDRQLNVIHGDLVERINQVRWDVGLLQQDMHETQTALYTLRSELSRVDQNIYSYLVDDLRVDFESDVRMYLRWRELHTTPMAYNPTFIEGEAAFFEWAYTRSPTSLLAGIPGRGSDHNVSPVTELAGRPLSYRINYLREFPVQLGLPVLDDDTNSENALAPLASPMDWAAGTEAYAQLFEQEPQHANAMAGTGYLDIASRGRTLNAVLGRIDAVLFDKLRDRYVNDWVATKTVLAQAEDAWENDASRRLYGIDMWSGTNQLPTRHYLKKAPAEGGLPLKDRPVVRCDGVAWMTGTNIPPPEEKMVINPETWSQDVVAALRPLLVADNLDTAGAELDYCVEGHWVEYSREVVPNRYPYYTLKFWLRTDLYIRFSYEDPADPTQRKSERVHHFSFAPAVDHDWDDEGNLITLFTPNITTSRVVHYNDLASFKPDEVLTPNNFVQGRWEDIVTIASVSHFLDGAGAMKAEMEPRLVQRLKDEQKYFYGYVWGRMGQAGDPLQVMSERVTGTKLVWDSYVALRLPLSLEHDEELRGLLYGEDSVLSGDDLKDDNDLNDLRDVYYAFAILPEPPPRNILTDLDRTLTRRADRLRDILRGSLAREGASGLEVGTWTEPSLLRLRLSIPPQLLP